MPEHRTTQYRRTIPPSPLPTRTDDLVHLASPIALRILFSRAFLTPARCCARRYRHLLRQRRVKHVLLTQKGPRPKSAPSPPLTSPTPPPPAHLKQDRVLVHDAVDVIVRHGVLEHLVDRLRECGRVGVLALVDPLADLLEADWLLDQVVVVRVLAPGRELVEDLWSRGWGRSARVRSAEGGFQAGRNSRQCSGGRGWAASKKSPQNARDISTAKRNVP